MRLADIKRGDKALVVAINANEELRNRFSSFGLIKGVYIRMLEYTLSKKSFKIEFNDTRLALRKSEAETIEVKLEK